MSTMGRSRSRTGLYARIPFATLAAGSCSTIGFICSWPLYNEIRSLTMRGDDALTGTLLKSQINLWMVRTVNFIICLEVLTIVMGFISTGPTRRKCFKTSNARAAGQVFCSVLILLHFSLLLCLICLNDLLIEAWDSKSGKQKIFRTENACMLFGHALVVDGSKKRYCDLSDEQMSAARVSLVVLNEAWRSAIAGFPFLLCGKVMSLMCVAAYHVRIKDHGRASECICVAKTKQLTSTHDAAQN